MTAATPISTARLRLRPIAPRDYPHWRAFYATEHSRFVDGPLDAEKAWWKVALLVGHWAMKGFGYWSVETRDGAYLGRVGIEQPETWDAPDLGWSFLPEAGGKGYATEAAAAILAHERRRMGFDEVVSFINPENAPSIRVAERLGATLDETTVSPLADHLVWRHPREAA